MTEDIKPTISKLTIVNFNNNNLNAFKFKKLVASMNRMFFLVRFDVLLMEEFYNYDALHLSPILTTKNKNFVKTYFKTALSTYNYDESTLAIWCYFILDSNGIPLEERVNDKLFNKKDILIIEEAVIELLTTVWIDDCEIDDEDNELLRKYAKDNPSIASNIYFMLLPPKS